MKQKITQTLSIPEGIACEKVGKTISCTKDSQTLTRAIPSTEIKVSFNSNEMTIACEKGNKIQRAQIMSLVAHMKNIFAGLQKNFTCILEACNVHFPMTAKIEKDIFIVNNFLGEKVQRKAKIVEGTKIEIKEQKSPTNPFTLTISGASREAVGQTAANIEYATKVRNRDRRIFQDGIYIVEKSRRSE